MEERKMLKKCICLLAAVLMFTACTNDDDNKANVSSESETVIDTNKIKEDKSTSDVEKAEQLALAGEQLMTPGGFFYADQIFDEALKYDSSNMRAQFYKALNAPMMNMKGIYTRVEPIVLKDSKETIRDYEEILEENNYAVAIKDFLIDGEKDIDSESKVQDFLQTQSKAYDQLRKFLKANKGKTLTINFPELLWKDAHSRRELICKTKETHHGTFYTNCDTDFNLHTVKIERADMEAMQQMTAGIVIYHTLLTAYDVSGAQAIHQALNPKGASDLAIIENSDKRIMEEINKHSSFGVLNDGNQLAGIIDLGSDALAGTRWAIKLQDKLCPEVKAYRKSAEDLKYEALYAKYGYQYNADLNEIRREGMAIEQGICIEKKTSEGKSVDKILKSIELALAGNIMTLKGYEHKTGNRVETLVKYSNLVENPIVDLKTLPKSYNECGNIESLSNDSLNGVFVNNDATEFAQITGNLDKNDCEAPL